MIHHSWHIETHTQVIGIQKSDRHYTYLHWKDQGLTDKFKYLSYNKNIDHKKYRPIGPTMLVEWTDE